MIAVHATSEIGLLFVLLESCGWITELFAHHSWPGDVRFCRKILWSHVLPPFAHQQRRVVVMGLRTDDISRLSASKLAGWAPILKIVLTSRFTIPVIKRSWLHLITRRRLLRMSSETATVSVCFIQSGQQLAGISPVLALQPPSMMSVWIEARAACKLLREAARSPPSEQIHRLQVSTRYW